MAENNSRAVVSLLIAAATGFLSILFYNLLGSHDPAIRGLVAGVLGAMTVFFLGYAIVGARPVERPVVRPAPIAGLEGRLARLEQAVAGYTVSLNNVVSRLESVAGTLPGQVAASVEAKVARLERAASRLEQAAGRAERAAGLLEDSASRAERASNMLSGRVEEAAETLERLESVAGRIDGNASRIEAAVSRLEGEVETLASKVAREAGEAVAAPLLVALYEARARLAAALLSQGVFDESACRSGGEALLASARAAMSAGRIGLALAVVDAQTILALEEAGCETGLGGEARRMLEEACARLGCPADRGVEGVLEALAGRRGLA